MYRRTKSDSPLKCPYCDHQFTMNGRAFNYERGKYNETTCKHCGKVFLYVNTTAKHAIENRIQPTIRKEE